MTEYDYKIIKELAKQNRCSVETYKVLATANEPFYAEVPAQKTKGDWFVEVWDRLELNTRRTVHIRRIHYMLVSQDDPIILFDGTPYKIPRSVGAS